MSKKHVKNLKLSGGSKKDDCLTVIKIINSFFRKFLETFPLLTDFSRHNTDDFLYSISKSQSNVFAVLLLQMTNIVRKESFMF